MFEFTLLAKDKKNKARVGEFHTPHGKLETPELAFVATEGEIKAVPKEILPTLPVRLIIVNTFHLWTRFRTSEDTCFEFFKEPTPPQAGGRDVPIKTKNTVSSLYTIHHYANFPRPVMSDSGGFQVFSMGFGKIHGVGKISNIFPEECGFESRRAGRKDAFEGKEDLNNPLNITEKGVEFFFNDQRLFLTPEKSIQLQQKIGADIMFAFDECTSPLNSKAYTKKAMKRTHRWLKRCLKVYNNRNQALFAIVQGGYFKDLRKISATYMAKQDVPGFGIGGSLGTTEEEVRDVLEWIIPYLPEEKPRHLLGIGKVKDIFDAVERGIDLFDCVIPTREARHQVLYTKKGKINVRKFKTVHELADKHCPCQMCREGLKLDELDKLYKLDKLKAFYFATVHNIQFFADLMKSIREAIEVNKFFQLKEEFFKEYYFH